MSAAPSSLSPYDLDSGGPSGGSGFERIVEAIAAQGYVIVDGAMAPAVAESLFIYLQNLDPNKFQPAGVGRLDAYQLDTLQRRDHIHWLDSGIPALAAYFRWIEELRLCINRRLFLGLFDYECHYACYPAGGFYRKHVDAFRGHSNRRLSTVLYLNPQWREEDGGALALYLEGEDAPFLKVLPEFGRMVLFLSEEFPHEVMPAQRSRFSLTGWYRVNGNADGLVDPPVGV